MKRYEVPGWGDITPEALDEAADHLTQRSAELVQRRIADGHRSPHWLDYASAQAATDALAARMQAQKCRAGGYPVAN